MPLFGNKSREEIQILFTIGFGIFGIVAFSTYSIINFVILDFPIAILEAALTIYTAVITLFLYRSKNIILATRYGVVPLVVITAHNFISGGFYGTGILWCYTFPLVATFISGRKNGVVLSSLFLMFTFIFFILFKAGLTPEFVTFLYNDFYYLMFVITFGGIAFMTYLIQSAWDASSYALMESQEKLENAIAEVAENNQELTRINKIMIDRELRMSELKSMLKKINKHGQEPGQP